jgi:hypothetical protein
MWSKYIDSNKLNDELCEGAGWVWGEAQGHDHNKYNNTFTVQSKRATAICFPVGPMDTARTSSFIFKVLTFVTLRCLASWNKRITL